MTKTNERVDLQQQESNSDHLLQAFEPLLNQYKTPLLVLIFSDHQVCSVESFCHCLQFGAGKSSPNIDRAILFDITSESWVILHTVRRDPGYCLACSNLTASVCAASCASLSRWDEHAPSSSAPSDGCISTAITRATPARRERMGPCAPLRRTVAAPSPQPSPAPLADKAMAVSVYASARIDSRARTPMPVGLKQGFVDGDAPLQRSVLLCNTSRVYDYVNH